MHHLKAVRQETAHVTNCVTEPARSNVTQSTHLYTSFIYDADIEAVSTELRLVSNQPENLIQQVLEEISQ